MEGPTAARAAIHRLAHAKLYAQSRYGTQVYAPRANGSYPVWIWLHGGGWTAGGSNESRLNGSWNVGATQAIIIVTINYRLNVRPMMSVDSREDLLGTILLSLCGICPSKVSFA